MKTKVCWVGVLAACAACAEAPSPTRADTEEEGKAIVAARGCASCHEASLSGDAKPRPGTHAYAANLTPDEETGLGAWTDDAIARAIRAGIDDQGASLCAPMPRFWDLSDADVDAVVAYLRSLSPVKKAIPTSRCEGEPTGPS